jgi:hypothetical protein
LEIIIPDNAVETGIKMKLTSGSALPGAIRKMHDTPFVIEPGRALPR